MRMFMMMRMRMFMMIIIMRMMRMRMNAHLIVTYIFPFWLSYYEYDLFILLSYAIQSPSLHGNSFLL